MKLGICLEGTEEKFEAALRERAKPWQSFVYLEIGVAQCGTFDAVASILNDTPAMWRAIGIDPSPETRELFDRKYCGRAHLITATREEAFRDHRDKIGDRLDFVFVDGCHSEPCATGDFLAVEPLVVPGGLVVFHDCRIGIGGRQPHCQMEPGVIPALEKLGLLDASRPGWNRLPDWNSVWPCGVFEKI